MTISPTSLPEWTQNKSGYSQTLTVSGGTGPYSWSIVGQSAGTGGCTGTAYPINSAATGLCLSTTGVLSGTPTVSGSFTFTVQVKDSSSPPNQATITFIITINPAPVILTTSLPNGVVGMAYSATLVSTGGTSSPTWAIISGALPTGLTLNSGTGVISGIPTAPTPTPTPSFTVQVTDSVGASTTQTLTLQINSVLNLSNPTSGAGSPPPAAVGTPYTYAFSATGGMAPYSWSVTAGSLPDGLSLNQNTGVLSGTPGAAGTFVFTVQVQDANGATAAKTFSITVYSGAVSSGTIALSPTAVDFGQVPVFATSAPQAVTVKNSGDSTLVISSISYPGGPFAVTNNTCSGKTALTALAPGEACEVDLVFNPIAEKTYFGFLTFTSSDPNNPSASVTLTGQGVVPAAAISLSSIDMDFGNVNVGTASNKTLTVNNIGTGKLVISSVKYPTAPFKIVADNCTGKALKPTASCTVVLKFKPTAVKAYAPHYLTLKTNDPTQPKVRVTLNGTGMQ
jgi:Putative Ig domain/HYDIN/CFA65/VesB-like, Ig-like domain/Cep192 domain 4